MKLFPFVKTKSTKCVALLSALIGLTAGVSGCGEGEEEATLYGCPESRDINHEECVAQYSQYSKLVDLCDSLGIDKFKENVDTCCKDSEDKLDWCKDYKQSGICANAPDPDISTKYGMPSTPIEPGD